MRVKKAGHPMQPISRDKYGTARFKENKIVSFLLDAYPGGLNALAMMPFSKEDQTQFAQLIGYSVSGLCDLSYIPNKVKDEAWKIMESLPNKKKKKG